MATAKMCVTCGSTIPSGERTYNEMCKACAVREAKKISANVESPRPASSTPNFDAAILGATRNVSNTIKEANREPWDGWSLIRAGCWCNVGSVLVLIAFFFVAALSQFPPVIWIGAVIASYLIFISSILILAGVIRIAIFPLVKQSEQTNQILLKLLSK